MIVSQRHYATSVNPRVNQKMSRFHFPDIDSSLPYLMSNRQINSSAVPSCSSGQVSRESVFTPNIKISSPDSETAKRLGDFTNSQPYPDNVRRAHVLQRQNHHIPSDDELDNEVFLGPSGGNRPPLSPIPALSSPVSNTPSSSAAASHPDEKQEIFSGRLYLLRQNSGAGDCSPPRSPSSPSKTFPTKAPKSLPRSQFPAFSPSPYNTTQPSSPKKIAVSGDKSLAYSPQHLARSPSSGSDSSPSLLSSSPLFSPVMSPSSSSPPLLSASSTPSSPTRTAARQKVGVFVRVYRCNLEHFAIISRDAMHTGKPVYVNMRHHRVLPGDSLGRFLVAGRTCDSGHVLEFEVPDLACLEKWLDAFHGSHTPPGSPNKLPGGSSGGFTTATTACNNNSNSSCCSPIPRSPALPTLTETDEED